MPVVDKNQLKIWFKNLSKPVQEQFWNWMDSFYHKSEPIPKSAVENLTTDLAKKADLVGGVVPASQLPFSVNTSEVIAVGEISATENTVTLAVHSSGTNAVRINGVVLTRNFPNNFNFTPVTDGSKFLIIYAVNENGIFRLAEGVEDLEAVEPEIPVGALFVRRILINSAGSDVELPALNGFREKVEDAWKVFTFSAPGEDKLLPFSMDKKTSFIINKATEFSGDLLLGGMKGNPSLTDNWWSGKEFTVFNQSGNNLILLAGYTGAGIKFNISSNVTVPSGKFVKLKVSTDLYSLEVLQLSGDSVNIDGKQDRLQDVTGNTGVGKTDASATEKLDIAGRTKSDGQVFNETTSAILPKEIKFKGGKFKAALADGVEKAVLLEGDVNNSSIGDLVLNYVHNGNTEIYINSIDYSTARITTNGAHGLNIGQTYSNVIIAPNNWYDSAINPPNFQNLFKVFPFEWFGASAQIRIYVVDSTTLEIRNSSNIALTVNQTSVENNGYLDSSKWHIEICPNFSITGIELGVLRFQLEMEGITNYTSGYFQILVYDNNNNVVSNSVSAPKFNARDVINMPAGVSGRIFNYFNFTLKTSVNEIFNNTLFAGYTIARNAGADNFGQQTTNMFLHKLFLSPSARNNNGISGFSNNPNLQFHFANGTKIRIYKYL